MAGARYAELGYWEEGYTEYVYQSTNPLIFIVPDRAAFRVPFEGLTRFAEPQTARRSFAVFEGLTRFAEPQTARRSFAVEQITDGITMSRFLTTKDPGSTLDYQIDWSAWLETGDTIESSTWVVPAGLTEVSDSATDDATTVWLSGGTAGASYTVVNQITTTGGRITERSIEIRMVEL